MSRFELVFVIMKEYLSQFDRYEYLGLLPDPFTNGRLDIYTSDRPRHLDQEPDLDTVGLDHW